MFAQVVEPDIVLQLIHGLLNAGPTGLVAGIFFWLFYRQLERDRDERAERQKQVDARQKDIDERWRYLMARYDAQHDELMKMFLPESRCKYKEK